MTCFSVINCEELITILNKLRSSKRDLDPVPTSFLKMVFDCVHNDVLTIVNCSLSTGVFPDAFKTALVKPMLKKELHGAFYTK